MFIARGVCQRHMLLHAGAVLEKTDRLLALAAHAPRVKYLRETIPTKVSVVTSLFLLIRLFLHAITVCVYVGVLISCSMKDGRLLKPTRPAMSIDSTFIQRAFGSGGPDGQLWAAFTEVHEV